MGHVAPRTATHNISPLKNPQALPASCETMSERGFEIFKWTKRLPESKVRLVCHLDSARKTLFAPTVFPLALLVRGHPH